MNEIIAFVSDQRHTDNEFSIECKSIEDIFHALQEAKERNFDHIHIEFDRRGTTNTYLGEVIVPFTNGIKIYTRL